VKIGSIGRVVVLAMAGTALGAFIEVPPFTLPLIVLDTPLTLQLTASWLVAPLLVLIAAAGSDWVVRLAGPDPDIAYAKAAASWMIPGVIAGAAPLTVARFSAGSTPWLLVFIAAGLALTIALAIEAAMAEQDAHSRRGHVAVMVLGYSAAIVAFTGIYSAHVRTIVSGTGVSIVGLMLGVAMLRWPVSGARHTWATATMVGLIVGLVTWGLNHTAVATPVAGGLLLLAFYVAVGLAQQVVERSWSRRTVLEMAAVALVGLLLLLGFARGSS
jgi:hypothetical protein